MYWTAGKKHTISFFAVLFLLSRNAIRWYCCVHQTTCSGDPEKMKGPENTHCIRSIKPQKLSLSVSCRSVIPVHFPGIRPAVADYILVLDKLQTKYCMYLCIPICY